MIVEQTPQLGSPIFCSQSGDGVKITWLVLGSTDWRMDSSVHTLMSGGGAAVRQLANQTSELHKSVDFRNFRIEVLLVACIFGQAVFVIYRVQVIL